MGIVQAQTMTGDIAWKERRVTPDRVMERIRPGMNIFLGTGLAEPRTLVKHLMAARGNNVQDLELIQLGSFGDIILTGETNARKYRLKTFYSGGVAHQAIAAGQVDLIPIRPSRIPALFESGRIPIDMAFFQITPPDPAGYSSLGVAVDVARQAMEQASLVVGEVNPHLPQTYGDNFVHVTDLDMLVQSTETPIFFERFTAPGVLDRVAANVASIIEDGSCLAFSTGLLFEALGRHLTHRRHLGIHSPFFTDALMDLVKSGAVTNRYKGNWRGKSVAAYAFGTPALMAWLDRNPLVEFQGIDKVFDPAQIGRNPKFVAVLAARKVDLTGRIALHVDKGKRLLIGRGGAADFFSGAELSPGGRKVIALPSRDQTGSPNILFSVEAYPIQFSVRESVDMVITEYGVANLYGRTIRERAQALIDIAHPDDRLRLLDQAKAARLIYPDQMYLPESAHLYPAEIQDTHTFKGDITVRFRAIRPSDEEEMRRLFYRFSDRSVYYRYFTHLKVMPHTKMQEYVNIDLNRSLSIVGLDGDPGKGRIIAEARYARLRTRPYAEVAFIVDEAYQGLGIATYMFKMLVRLARERGIKGFIASVLTSNRAMMKVFKKRGESVEIRLEEESFWLTIPFSADADDSDPPQCCLKT